VIINRIFRHSSHLPVALSAPVIYSLDIRSHAITHHQ
jgi:hypothetical protein